MHDIVAIGDIVTDAFIRLPIESGARKEDGSRISLPFGDKVPYESVEVIRAVGNAPNASVAAARLGLKSALVTNLGDDEAGEECIASLKKDKVSTDFVTVHKGEKTNYHYVLWFEDDRTILVKHEAYKYRLPDIGEPKWIYLSSLGDHTEEYHGEITKYLEAHPGVKLAFQPGTFQIKLGKEKLESIYKKTDIFFSNIEEAERILGLNTLGTEELMKKMHALGPKIVVLTDGPKGAHAYDGDKFYFQKPFPDPKPPFERTGAGDAFASSVVSALILGKDLEAAFDWGMVNSMSVVQQVGAQKGLLTRDALESYLRP